MQPARPGAQPRLLVDAGRGGIGSPSVSFDGQSIYVAMAQDGEPFFHIYRIPADGGPPQRLTDGPFHDIDPAELPDGRIVFTSTRIGTFEEYHNPPSRALFAMNADGSGIRPLTHTFIFDNEPEVLADGRILFIRSDNFFDRGKVETLLHAVHPDGTRGLHGVRAGHRARTTAAGCGRSTAAARRPCPTAGWPSSPARASPSAGPAAAERLAALAGCAAGDVAALPDGRLLCTVGARGHVEDRRSASRSAPARTSVYEKIAVVDPQEPRRGGRRALRFARRAAPFAGLPRARAAPAGACRRRSIRPSWPTRRPPASSSARTPASRKNTTAGWPHVRAIRVLAGKGLTTRSSHSYIVHAGSEVIELGTVPLAPDGSFAVEVPADTAIAFQAVDAEGRSELNEMSWIYVRPGEARGCVGCHQPRQADAAAGRATAAGPVAPGRCGCWARASRTASAATTPAVTGLMELQFDRYREVAGINRHSQTAEPLATGTAGSGRAGRPTAGRRRRPEDLRGPAAGDLPRSRRRRPPWPSCLGDDSREVRVAAAMALAACGTRESVPPLLAALATGDPLVAQAAAVALENLTGHAEPFDAFAAPAERAAQAETWRALVRSRPPGQSIEQELVAAAGRTPTATWSAARPSPWGTSAQRRRARRPADLRGPRAREQSVSRNGARPISGDGARFNSLSPANPRTLQAATRSLGYLQDVEAAAPAGRDARPPQRSGHGQPVPGRGGRRGARPHRHARGRGRAGPSLGRAEGLLPLRRLVRRPPGAVSPATPRRCTTSSPRPSTHRVRSAPAAIVPHLIRSVPTDPDRALLPGNDDCETLVGRVIRRAGRRGGRGRDLPGHARRSAGRRASPRSSRPSARPTPPGPASPIPRTAPRRSSRWSAAIAATSRASAPPSTATGPGRWSTSTGSSPAALPHKLPTQHWVCFFLARTLGNLADPHSVDALVAALEQCPPEGSLGHPDPTGPGALFLHNDFTPCWRAAAAWALGQIGDRRAGPALLAVIGDLNNATDTRHAAAESLARLARPGQRRGRPHAGVQLSRGLRAQSPLASGRQAGPRNRITHRPRRPVIRAEPKKEPPSQPVAWASARKSLVAWASARFRDDA